MYELKPLSWIEFSQTVFYNPRLKISRVLKKDHLFMIAQLVVKRNFKSLYIRLLAVNAHLRV